MLDGDNGYRKRIVQGKEDQDGWEHWGQGIQFKPNLNLNAIKRLKKLKHPLLALV